MKVLIVLLVCWFMISAPSCSADEPLCIDEMIENFQILNDGRSFTGIYTFEQDRETFYVFDSGIAFDATASVVDQSCTEVCVFGGLRADNPLPCDAYQEGINNRTQIWP